MYTELQSSPRNHLAYGPYHMQCPRCGTDNPGLMGIHYQNPRTGKYQRPSVLLACLIPIVVFFAISYIVELSVGNPWLITGPNPPHPPSSFEYLGIFFAIFSAIMSIPLYLVWSLIRLSKTHISVWRLMCRQCAMEWTV